MKAALSDIAAYFRILLGREPSMEESIVRTRTHVGNDLADVLKSSSDSDEFRNRKIVRILKSEPSGTTMYGR